MDIFDPSYLAVSPQRSFKLPYPNVFDITVPPEVKPTFVAAAYSALLWPLPLGEHTIRVTIEGGPFAGTNHAKVIVER